MTDPFGAFAPFLPAGSSGSVIVEIGGQQRIMHATAAGSLDQWPADLRNRKDIKLRSESTTLAKVRTIQAMLQRGAQPVRVWHRDGRGMITGWSVAEQQARRA